MKVLLLDLTADTNNARIFDGLAGVTRRSARRVKRSLKFDRYKSEELRLRTLGDVFVVADKDYTTSLEAWLDYRCNFAYLRIRAPETEVVDGLVAIAHECFKILDRKSVLKAARKKQRQSRDVARLAFVVEGGSTDDEVFALLAEALKGPGLGPKTGAIHAMKLLTWSKFVPLLEASQEGLDASLRFDLADALKACSATG